jgi:hypothetical protein
MNLKEDNNNEKNKNNQFNIIGSNLYHNLT